MVLAILIYSLAFFQDNPNLVPNPGFEESEKDDLSDWTYVIPKQSTSHVMGIDEHEYHSGNRSFRISRVWAYPRKAVELKMAETIELDPAKKYLLSFWYKTSDIVEYGLPFSAQFTIECEQNPTATYSKFISNASQWSQYFILLDNIPRDAKNIRISFHTRVNTKGSIWLDDVEFTEVDEHGVKAFEKWRRQPIPSLAGKKTQERLPATGFFRVEQLESGWTIVDPEGYPFWAMAIAGTKRPARALPAEENVHSLVHERMTSDAINEIMYSVFMDRCGFNSLAGWSADDYGRLSEERKKENKPYLPMTKVLGLASSTRNRNVYARDRDGNVLNGAHPFPDPFNPEWKQAARVKAERTIAPYRDEPSFMGWYVDNEIDFSELFRYIWAEHSSKEFVRQLQSKFGDIESLNRAWSSPSRLFDYTSFDSILTEKPEPRDWDDPLWEDFLAFERRMMAEYINYTYALVKELDPNHLVISNRINLDPMPELHRTIDLWSRYDIVCMNIYPDNNMIGFNPGELEIMHKLYEGTGRPLMIGEWSLPSFDSGLYGFGKDSLNRPADWSWPQVLRNEKERAEAYQVCLKQLASLDFMIGAGWFITFDVNTKDRRANRGIMRTNYALYDELVATMKRTHDDIRKHLGFN